MERQDAAMTILQDHVIVAVFAETDSPLIGLRNLVMPIRASNIHYKDLIHVVIVGNVDYLKSKLELELEPIYTNSLVNSTFGSGKIMLNEFCFEADKVKLVNTI